MRVRRVAGSGSGRAGALRPAGILAGIRGFVYYAVTRLSPGVIPAAIVGVTLIAECWIAVELLGPVLERTDATAIEPTE